MFRPVAPDLNKRYRLQNTLEDFDPSLIVDAVEDEIAVIDADGRIVAVNAAWCAFAESGGAGDTNGFLGVNYLDVCRAPGANADNVVTAIREAIEVARGSTLEYPCPANGAERWFELQIDPLPRSKQTLVMLRHRDVTPRRAMSTLANAARIDSELLGALVQTSTDAIISYDLDGLVRTWNAAAEALYGYSAEQIIGQSMERLYPEGCTKRIGDYRDEIIAGKLTSFEATRMTSTGKPRLVWIAAAPIRDGEGRVIAVSNIHRDITEIRKHQDSRQIVAQEVIHRAKNMLTVISAIHRRTAASAGSMEEFNEKFGERIASLSRSADFLTSEDWATVSLDALIRSQLALFAHDDTRLTVDGAAVELRPQAVKTIGMALHELGTNATKYGALGDNGGEVAIRWRLTPAEDGKPALVVEWIETGPSFDTPPRHRGFGNTVLTRLAGSLLDAEVTYNFTPAGVLWSISIPAPHFTVTEKSQTPAKD